jgi:hypothetical protein
MEDKIPEKIHNRTHCKGHCKEQNEIKKQFFDFHFPSCSPKAKSIVLVTFFKNKLDQVLFMVERFG